MANPLLNAVERHCLSLPSSWSAEEGKAFLVAGYEAVARDRAENVFLNLDEFGAGKTLDEIEQHLFGRGMVLLECIRATHAHYAIPHEGWAEAAEVAAAAAYRKRLEELFATNGGGSA